MRLNRLSSKNKFQGKQKKNNQTGRTQTQPQQHVTEFHSKTWFASIELATLLEQPLYSMASLIQLRPAIYTTRPRNFKKPLNRDRRIIYLAVQYSYYNFYVCKCDTEIVTMYSLLTGCASSPSRNTAYIYTMQGHKQLISLCVNYMDDGECAGKRALYMLCSCK